MTTQVAFLDAYYAAMIRRYARQDEGVKIARYIFQAPSVIDTPGAKFEMHLAASDAWRAIGGEKKFSMKKLRALPKGDAA